jgi:glycine/D-amino acid oxidase-like deaminating enzyme
VSDTADVVIAGGGVIGSSVGWQLRQDGFTGRIVVCERDPTYRRASAFLAMGGIRQQFCTAVTVRMVQYSIQLWKEFDRRLAGPGRVPRAEFCQRGYLFLADHRSAQSLTERFEQELQAGANVRWVTPEDIRQMVPDLVLDDIVFGIFGPDDGYANPQEVLFGFRRAAEEAGVEFRAAGVVGVERRSGRVTGVRLENGTTISAPAVVNAAGAWAGRVAESAGLAVPIEPLRQMLFRCTLPRRWPYRFPVVIDPGGVHWRHNDPATSADPDAITVAFTNWAETPGENFEADNARWAREFHPALIRRLQALRDVSDVTGWAGLYEMTPDHNPVLGEHPSLAGFVFANGFSGHGLMMSPATARIVSEWIRLGRSETFDVRIFAPDRFERGVPVHDAATI